MHPVSFFTEDIKFTLTNRTHIRKWLEASIKNEGYKVHEINYIFCSDKYLLRMNRDFLHHNEYTDIITFEYQDASIKKQGKKISGDIYISIPRIKENAKLFKTTFQNELHRVIIHGILHLCGYKDKTQSQKTAIRSKEDFYLSKLTVIGKR